MLELIGRVVSLLFIAYARSDNSNEMCGLKGKKTKNVQKLQSLFA